MPRGGVIFYARGAPPPLARAAALEDSLSSRGPQALGLGSARHPSVAATLGTPAWPQALSPVREALGRECYPTSANEAPAAGARRRGPQRGCRVGVARRREARRSRAAERERVAALSRCEARRRGATAQIGRASCRE